MAEPDAPYSAMRMYMNQERQRLERLIAMAPDADMRAKLEAKLTDFDDEPEQFWRAVEESAVHRTGKES
jgi:hypothetical protein